MKKKNSAIMILAILLAVGSLSAVLLFSSEKPAAGEQDQLKKFSSYDELKGFLKDNQEKTRYSYFGSFGRGFSPPMMMEASVTAATKDSASSADYSTTNIQVEGVDEADIVKNDGKYIYAIAGKKLFIVDAYPAENAEVVSETKLKGTPVEIFVNKDKLVVFGRDYNHQSNDDIGRLAYPRPFNEDATLIEVYDITNRETPKKAKELTLSGGYHGSRMIGDYVYAVVNQPVRYYEGPEPVPLPAIMENSKVKEVPASEIHYFDAPDYGYSYINVFALNTQDDAEEYTSKTYLTGNTQNIYVSIGNIYITRTIRNNIYTAGNIIDEIIIPSLPTAVADNVEGIQRLGIEAGQKMEQIGEAVNSYMNGLDENEKDEFEMKIQRRTSEFEKRLEKETEKTAIHKIAISGGKIDYKGQGSVPGHVLNQFSMDENKGYFRIATTTPSGGFSTSTNSQNSIYVLDDDLNIIGAVEGLAPGESIYSARFMGDRAYLVTFVKIDPLFVIDLSQPENPKVLGKLKIPGYSDYLHPYDENHIIGIGKEAIGSEQGDFAWYQGVKLALFDVTEPENPREVSKYEIGDRGTDSEALHEHKAFMFDRQKNLLVIPVLLAETDKAKHAEDLPSWAYGDYTWQGAYVFNLDTENGFQLKGKVTHLPEDDDSLLKSGYYYGGSPYAIKRSLYMDDALYTISDSKIKMNELSTLREIKSLELKSGFT